LQFQQLRGGGSHNGMAQRIFLTGGTGFFGVHAAAVFLQRGYQVALGTRQPMFYAHTPLAAWVVQANILNQEELFFDGQKGGYVEEDVAKPIIEYGRTKLLAESLFQRQVLLSQWIIVRTSLMFGHPLPWNPGYPGFASEALRQGKSRSGL